MSKSFGARDGKSRPSTDLDLEIKDNSFVTLLGPSGCGKTTTLRLIAGYIVPDSGTIEVDGRLLSSPGAVVPPEARGMGMVFQNYAVWPHKTVFENVVFGLKLRKVPRGRGEEEGRRHARAGQSRRSRKRAIRTSFAAASSSASRWRARSWSSRSILLLDEPLSNLDAKLRERMRVELKELQRRTGITFVYVTHDQAEALALSDQIAVMNAGRLQQFGTPFEVYADPANRMVADFMGLVNLVPGEVRALRNGGGTVKLSAALRSTFARARRLARGRQRRRRDPAGEHPPAAGAAPRRVASPRSPTTSSSAISANITRRCRPARCCACRPIRCEHFNVGDTVGVEVDADAMQRLPPRRGRQAGAVIAVRTGACRPVLPWRG